MSTRRRIDALERAVADTRAARRGAYDRQRWHLILSDAEGRRLSEAVAKRCAVAPEMARWRDKTYGRRGATATDAERAEAEALVDPETRELMRRLDAKFAELRAAAAAAKEGGRGG